MQNRAITPASCTLFFLILTMVLFRLRIRKEAANTPFRIG
jgi:hypothetical protein